MMTKIRLYGDLARRFGRYFEANVRTPKEAIEALFSQCKGMREYFDARPDHGYRVFVGDGPSIGFNEVQICHGGADIAIMPEFCGAKKAGVGQIIIGVVMVVIGVVINVYSYGGASPLGNAFITSGVAMIIGGVAQLIIGVPSPENPKEKGENQPSYLFSGPVNTTAQGHRVPVGYGRLRVGSAVIYAGINTVNYLRGRRGGGGSGGSGDGDRCVSPDAIIDTKQGPVRAGDIKVGDIVVTAAEDTMHWGEFEVEAVELGAADCWVLILEDGRRLIATENHRVMVNDPRAQIIYWSEMRNLCVGDLLHGSNPGVVKEIRPTGVQDIVKITVKDAKTFCSEGILSHNVKKLDRYDLVSYV